MADYSFNILSRISISITRRDQEQEKIVAAAKPLLAELRQNPNCIEPQFKRQAARPTAATCSPRAAVQYLFGGLGSRRRAKAHNHDTWGLVGVLENEFQETRFRSRDDGTKEGHAELEAKA